MQALALLLRIDLSLFSFVGLLVIIAASYTFARVLADPRHVLYPIGVIALLLPLGVLQIGVSMGIDEVVPLVIGLHIAGMVLLFKVGRVIQNEDSLGLLPDLLTRAMLGTTPGGERPHLVRVDPPAIPPKRLREFGQYLKEVGLITSVGRRKGGATFIIGRISPRKSKELSHLWPLFGATKITIAERADIAVEPRTFQFLDRPGPLKKYCENIVALLEQEHIRFASRPSMASH